jgi:hypothetical protein
MLRTLFICVVSMGALFTFSLAEASQVIICHKPGTPAERDLHVDESAVQGHLGHGDSVGSCSAPVVCPQACRDAIDETETEVYSCLGDFGILVNECGIDDQSGAGFVDLSEGECGNNILIEENHCVAEDLKPGVGSGIPTPVDVPLTDAQQDACAEYAVSHLTIDGVCTIN